MPEFPDIALYIEALTDRLVGRALRRVHVQNPFLVRTVEPPIDALRDRIVLAFSRVGKRIVFEFDQDLFLVVHLMIAGRLRWRRGDEKNPAAKIILATLEFDHGRLFLTEAGSTRRASLHAFRGRAGVSGLDAGGLDPLAASPEAFRAALTRESHTIKRALTDPSLVSGIGNAYSDEILHAARLSPLKLARTLTDEQWSLLYSATRDVLTGWLDRLRREAAGEFPETVTAFRPGMAVHGRFKQPCPVCAMPVQRIVYAENECNYCARCQTGGRLLADRSLSRLLRDAWPRTVDGT